MVGLVFQSLGQQLIGVDADDFSVQTQRPSPYLYRTFHRSPVPGYAQAAFHNLPFPFPFDDLGVDQHQRLLHFGGLDDAHLLKRTHLVGRDADAFLVIHGLDHVAGQPF